jgi:Zn-dependent peptidase ImmA (M78 family)
MPNERGLFRAGSYDGIDVTISDNQTAGAKRFTEAHEIAHMHLHPGEAHLRERSGAPKALKEHEADCFATNLLMPRELVAEEFTDRFRGSLVIGTIDDDSAYALTAGKLSPSQIRKMSCRQFADMIAKANWFEGHHFDPLKDVFGVSLEAMARRLVELRLVLQD